MQLRRSLVAVCLVPFLLGNNGGCGTTQLPTVQQIELYLPDSVRNCAAAPKSPGKSATRRQTAAYITKLYGAWKDCHGDVRTVDKLYRQWRAKVDALKG